MAYPYEYPYTDPNRHNDDWAINEVKKCIAGFEATETHFKTIDEALAAIEKEIAGWFVDPLLYTAIRKVLREMYEDGRLEELVRNVLDIEIYENEYTLFGRVPSPNGFFTGAPFAWIVDKLATNFKDCIKIGANTFKNCINGVSDCIGIGTGVMSEHQVGNHNIGIGMFALSNLQGTGDNSGTRNIGIGSYAYLFAKNLQKSVGIGRDVAQNVVSGINNTLVGYATMGGYAHIGLDGTVVNGAEISATKATMLGASAMSNTNDVANTVTIGAFAAFNAKNSNANVIIGSNALLQNGVDTSLHGKTLLAASDNGTYIANGSNIIVTIANNHAVAGNYVRIKFTSGALAENTSEEQLLYVSQNGDPEFILITDYDNLSGEGNCIVNYYETNTPTDYDFSENVAIGNNVMENTKRVTQSTVMGSSALVNTDRVKYTTVIGRNSGYNGLTSAEGLTGVGNGVASDVNTSYHDTFIGNSTGNAFHDSNGNTCVGYGAGSLMIDGTTGADITNTTVIGYGTRCSGSNEVCLGGAGTTPYAYNALQVRSDIRDKTDIRDSVLGLDFIEKLRPVDYKWNYRELYENNDNSSEELKGTRYHHGFIAQEVGEIIKETGVDFGGYQDHTVNGGCDVQTIGYEELIAPMVAAIKELSARVKELENK